MADCTHEWEMANVTFGFVVFERCPHCMTVRTYFSPDRNATDEYREGLCTWHTVENAQSLKFDLRCRKCGHTEGLSELMGLLYCTECLAECEVMRLQQKLLADKTLPIVAFGYLPGAKSRPLPPHKLDALTDYFNQHRDVSRSKVKVLPFQLIKEISKCEGEFIHDVGVLSLEPEVARKHLL
jgi:hypothetical protein